MAAKSYIKLSELFGQSFLSCEISYESETTSPQTRIRFYNIMCYLKMEMK